MIASDLIETNFVKIDVNDKVSSLVGKFRKKKHSEAVVLKNNLFEGIAAKRFFLRLRQNLNEMKVKEVTVKVPQLKLSTPVEKIPALMDSADTHMLPIVENKEVKGVVTAFKLLGSLRKSFRGIKVFELLDDSLITLEENAPISKAINLFKQKKIGHLPIVGKNGKLIGMVAITNLIARYYLFPPKREQRYGGRMPHSHTWKEEDMTKLPIGNEVSPLVYSAEKNDSLTKIIDIIKENRISSVIITENKNIPIGIVTVKDLMKLYGSLG